MASLGFFQLLKKKKELIPLVSFVSFAGVAAVFSSLYAFTKSDVIVNKQGNPEPWEQVDPSKPQKLLSINQEWKPIEELEKVRKLMK
ncbi:normal mucosa of esophagus-specific gene 1 protein-like [Heteronotia binoei]|uniref:normal mucosa of esophagus-specific gene 1 protein-like n=1 Tax=Heteronotia binoei TaxID=13085 RepID=UPI00292D7A8F|nr:normal mucosa of esophagus-specific gene 1 protein-like [Heteronotia binoei]